MGGTRGKKTKEPDEDSGYHTPVWPPYVVPAGKEPHRTLCLLRPARDQEQAEHELLTEHDEVLPIASWAELSDALFDIDGLCFAGPLQEALAPYLECIAHETRGTKDDRPHHQWCEWTIAPNSGQLVSLIVHRHPRTRKVVYSGVWAGRAPEPALLRDLRWAFTSLSVGDHATPGALGAAKMGAFWRKDKDDPDPDAQGRDFTRHHRPPIRCVLALQKYAVGARKEAYAPLETYDNAWELDRANGYAAEIGDLPSGTTRHLMNGTQYLHPDASRAPYRHMMHEFTWWGQCFVRIGPAGLPPGDIAPFAVRDEQTGELTWPTGPGGYLCWLWKDEAEEIERLRREEGRDIEIQGIGEAWYWDGHTTQLRAWAIAMDAVRTIARSAAGLHSKPRADLVKSAIVAAIGRLGMEYTRVSVVPEEEAQPGDTPLISEDCPDTGLYVRKTPYDAGWPKHWHAFVLARMNLNVYRAMRDEYKQSGMRPVAVNTDGVIWPDEPMQGVMPSEAQLGEYKKQAIGWTSAPAPGIILAEGKLATPGMDKASRGRIMRFGEGGGKHRETERERHRRQGGDALRTQLQRLRLAYLQKRESG